MNFLSTIIDYLNPFSDNFFGKKIIELLGDLLKSLFVPSEDRINSLIYSVTSKFDFIESIKQAISSLQEIINNIGEAPKLAIPVGSTKYTDEKSMVILDLSFYKPFKNYGDLILTAFIYAFFIWRLFIRLPGIIRGDSYFIDNIKKDR